jgi:exosome complex component CSL4
LDEKRRESEKLIFPGERLGVIEEFLPGQGTYVENGNIFSATTGYVQRDTINKETQVQSRVKTPRVPQTGDVVIGQVSSVQDKTLSIDIFQINDVVINTSFTGVMHVSNASQAYVKTMFDVFKVGDVVRAKVMSTMNREFHLTTEGSNLGVIQAACSQCGDHLIIRNRRLGCPSCHGSERRKLASDYGEDA